MERKYGWIRQGQDNRDHKLRFPNNTPLPPFVDLIPKMPAVYDQGQTSSCTANAISGAIEYELLKQGLTDFVPSRLFIYYNERMVEGSVSEDGGAIIRDGIKVVNKYGVCHETEWPFDPSKLTIKPIDQCYADALKDKVVQYSSISQDEHSIKACLALGYPVVVGIELYSNFESDEVAKTGIVNLPTEDEEYLGGHAVLVVGYDDVTRRFSVRNSWGAQWGVQGGYFSLPYVYLTNPQFSSDFWAIKLIDQTA